MARKKKKKTSSGQKSSSAVVKLRVAEILRIRVAGATWTDICQFASEKPEPDDSTGRPWKVSERQLQRYTEQADELLEQQLEKRRNRLLNMHLARRQLLFAESLQMRDLRTALAVLKDDAELHDLYPADGSAKEMQALALRLAALVSKRLPEDEQAGFAEELAALVAGGK